MTLSDELLSKLTIIIPTYERKRFVLRNMKSWAGTAVTVHVLDGSADAIEESALRGMANNVHYHHLRVSLHDRLKLSLDLIETEYVALLCDDEFFLLSGIESCLSELENDKALVSCIGRTLSFEYSDGQVKGKIHYENQKDHSLSHEEPEARMVAHMKDFTPSTIYSVVRADVWKNAWEPFVLEDEREVYAIGELIFELAAVFQGKTKVISELFWLRSWENRGISNTGIDRSLDFEKSFDLWWNDKNKLPEKQAFLSEMERHLNKEDKYQAGDIARSVELALDQYCATSGPASTLRGFLIRYLPPSTIVFMKSLLKLAGIGSPANIKDEALRLKQDTDFSYSESDLNVICDIVSEFYEESA